MGASPILRLGTRGSLLAMQQARIVADELAKHHPELQLETIIRKTTGDRIQDRPLHELGGKGLFTKEIEESLLDGTIDFAVHSFKDLPVTMPLVEQSNLTIAAVLVREDVRDVLICRSSKSIAELGEGAKVGTCSLRRRCQLLEARPDLNVEMIRGNIDTRLRKLREGQFDAITLALAGLKRAGLLNPREMTPIPLEQMLPAAGQGALVFQCRKDDARAIELLSVLDDPISRRCVELERSLVRALDGDCHSPIAALATIEESRIRLRAAVGARGGGLPVVHADAVGDSPAEALQQVVQVLKS